ncbi:unnamed protein product (mitochondrion) [Plasmodiophora brassicae]|uniref:Uncharacterized protein n=1 Tax=Plasmodiophora brassicae TaxID=37360 RepID=A0A3P3YFB8_PLABS|nr:unnamed protein product [Plasmodiophora brassicae]
MPSPEDSASSCGRGSSIAEPSPDLPAPPRTALVSILNRRSAPPVDVAVPSAGRLTDAALNLLQAAAACDSSDDAASLLLRLITHIEHTSVHEAKVEPLSCPDGRAAPNAMVASCRTLLTKFPRDPHVQINLASVLIRLAAINDEDLEPAVKFLTTDCVRSIPSATFDALGNALPTLLEQVHNDSDLNGLLTILLKLAAHPWYYQSAIDVVIGEIHRVVHLWASLAPGSLPKYFRLLALLAQHSAVTLDLFLDYVPCLVGHVIVRTASSRIRDVTSMTDSESHVFLEALRLIASLSSHSSTLADAFASALFDLVINELIRGPRLRMDRASCTARTALAPRRERLCRLFDVANGILSTSTMNLLQDDSTCEKVKRGVVDVTSAAFPVFAGPGCALMLTLYKKRGACADTVWTGPLGLVELVQQISRMILAHERTTAPGIGAVEAFVNVIRLVVHCSSSSTAPPPDIDYERVLKVTTKRLLETVAAVDHWAVRSEALNALSVLGASRYPSLVTALIANATKSFRHHLHDSATALIHIAFRIVANDLGAEHKDLDPAGIIGGITGLLESCNDASERDSDPLIENADGITRVRQACVKFLHLAWRNAALWDAVMALPTARVRLLLVKTLLGEFVAAVEPASNDVTTGAAIEQTPLAFDVGVVLGALDDLTVIAEAAAFTSQLEASVGVSGAVGQEQRLRAHLQRIRFRCIVQIADTVAGDRKRDVVRRLVDSADNLQAWLALPDGRTIEDIVARESAPWCDDDANGRRPLHLVPMQVEHAPSVHRLLRGAQHSEEHWRQVAAQEVRPPGERHFVVRAGPGPDIVAVAGVAPDPNDADVALVHTFVVDDTIDAQDLYDARLDLISHITRRAGRRRLRMAGRAHEAWLARHDNVFRKADVKSADGETMFEWEARPDVSLEELIEHDGTAAQGLPNFDCGLARLHTSIELMVPHASRVTLSSTYPLRSRIESRVRHLSEKAMCRPHADSEGNALTPVSSSPKPSPFLSTLESFSSGESQQDTVGTDKDKTFGFAAHVHSPSVPLSASDEHTSPATKLDEIRRRRWAIPATIANVDVGALALSAYLRLCLSLLTATNSAMLSAVLYKAPHGITVNLGAKLLDILTASLVEMPSTTGAKPFLDQCQDVQVAAHVATSLLSKAVDAIHARPWSGRRLAPAVESMMAGAAAAFAAAIDAVRRMRYLTHLLKDSATSSAEDETSGTYLHRLAKLNADLQTSTLADLVPEQYIRDLLQYDMELADDPVEDIGHKAGIGCCTALDTMRIHLRWILADAASGPLLKDYVCMGVSDQPSLRASYLADIIAGAKVGALRVGLESRFREAQVFAANELIETLACIEDPPRPGPRSDAPSAPRVLILSSHYVYLGASFTSPPTSFERIPYADLYDTYVDATGQEVTIGCAGRDGNARLVRQTWELCPFGCVDKILAVVTRKCRLFCSRMWHVSRAPAPGPGVRICTRVDVQQDNGTLVRRTLVWAREQHNGTRLEILYAGDDETGSPDLSGSRWNILMTLGWVDGCNAVGGYFAVDKIDAVEVSDTSRAIMTVGIGARKLTVLFVCDASREVWHRALRAAATSVDPKDEAGRRPRVSSI